MEESASTSRPKFGMILKILLALAVLSLGGLAFAWHYALDLPNESQMGASLVIPKPQYLLWAKVRDVQSYPNWRTGLRAIMPQDSGENGLIRWTEVRGRQMTYCEAVSEKLPDSLVIELVSDRNTFHKRWTWSLESLPPDSTRVTLVETKILQAPLLRLARHWFPVQETELTAVLTDLSK